jgi:hypothetical protein
VDKGMIMALQSVLISGYTLKLYVDVCRSLSKCFEEQAKAGLKDVYPLLLVSRLRQFLFSF